MRNIQRIGGLAALVLGASYVIGIGIYATLLNAPDVDTPAEKLAYLADNEAASLVVTIIIYIVAGIALVPLSLGVYDRLKSERGATMQVATVFGLIWAGVVVASGMIYNIGVASLVDIKDSDPEVAVAAWQAVSAVSDGLGGGSELIGAIWVLLVTVSAWKTSKLPLGLNCLGLVVATAGALTVIPALSIFQDVFGLSQIPWFIWLGSIMIQSSRSIEADTMTPSMGHRVA
jgi:hypothetical protein